MSYDGNPGSLKWQIGMCLLRIGDCVRGEDLGAFRNHVRWLLTLARPWIKDLKPEKPCSKCGHGGPFELPPTEMEDEEEYEHLNRIVERVLDILATKSVIAYTEPTPEDASDLALKAPEIPKGARS